MKKSRNIIILVVLFGLLVGSYFYLANRPEEQEEPKNEKITILDFDKNDIVKIELKSVNGELTFHKVEKEVEEEKDGEKQKVAKSMWEVEYPHEIELRQTEVDDIAYTFASLRAERIIEEETPEDLSSYGLKEPQAVGKATLNDGSEKILYLGDKTPSGSTYYLMVEGDPRVYEVWMNHGENLLSTLSDVRDKNLPKVDTQGITYFMVDKKDGRPIEIKANDEQSEDDALIGLGLWQMSKPYNEPMGVDSQAFQEMMDNITSFSIEEFIADGVEDLAKYGLDEPSMEIILKDKANTLHLLFGDEYDENMIYFKTPDSNSVYGMAKSHLDDIVSVKPFELVEKFAYIVNIDNVDKVIVEGRGKTYTLTLERETKESENEDEEDEVITTYKVNGKEVEEKPFKKTYQSIIGILVDAESSKDLEENPEVKTTFFLNKGPDREVHINYVHYDNDFYAVFRGGKAEFIVNKGIVHSMLDDIEALLSGNVKD